MITQTQILGHFLGEPELEKRKPLRIISAVSLQGGCLSWHPVNNDKAPKGKITYKDSTRNIVSAEAVAIDLNTRMWANAQRDGRPAKHSWRPLFNAAKFCWRPLLDCRAVTLPRRETRWNLQGCLKLANRSQPLVSRSSSYCGDIWRTYCRLTSFFQLSICALVAKI